MTVVPVITRELRASARQPFTYYVRVLGATALLVVSLIFGLKLGFDPSMGRLLFSALHGTLFCAIWLLVPLLTADCISRERREGTLGLLFLTPLQGTEIVLAKGVAHGLRAVTLGLAVLPVLTLSFLLGGVSVGDALLSVAINTNAICLALTAGLVASTWSKSRLRAIVLALLFGLSFLFAMSVAAGGFLLQAARRGPLTPFSEGVGYAFSAGFWSLAYGGSHPGYFARWFTAKEVYSATARTSLISLCILFAALFAAGRKTRRSWQEEPPSARRLWLRQTFCTPVLWLRFFRRWMRRKLERNPVGWLEQRTWSGRLVTWAWFAVLISIYSWIMTDRSFTGGSSELHQTLAWLLAGSMAMSAAGSFQRERESGVLELLLVSTLGEGDIIAGRLGGLWGQFAPAAVLLLAIWAYFSTFLPGDASAQPFLFFMVAFLTVPVFGLYFSLRCRTFLSGFLATVGVGLLLPLVLGEALRALWWWSGFAPLSSEYEVEMGPSALAATCQAVLAVVCWGRMFRRLRQRSFPLQRATA